MVRLGARSADRRALPQLPGQPFLTRLTNYTGKGTYTLSQNNKFVGYGQWGRKQQPNRLDYYTTASTAAQHDEADSTWNQQYWGHVWKVEWNSVLRNKAFLEFRDGQFGYVWPNYRNAETPSFQDLGNNQVTRRQPRLAADIAARSSSTPRPASSRTAGSARTTSSSAARCCARSITQYRGHNSERRQRFPGNVLHRLRNGEPVEVICSRAPTESINGLWTYGGYVERHVAAGQPPDVQPRPALRALSQLPAGAGARARARFFPEALSYAAKDDVFTWNLLSPRVGVNYDLTGDGKTLLKFNYGQYLVESRHRPRGQRQQEPARLVPPLRVDRSERRRRVAARRSRARSSRPRAAAPRRRSIPIWRTPTRASSRCGSIASCCQTSASAAASSIGASISSIRPTTRTGPMTASRVPITVTDPGPDGSLGDDGRQRRVVHALQPRAGLRRRCRRRTTSPTATA